MSTTKLKVMPLTLKVLPLTKKAFTPFGDVIETEGSDFYYINQGSTQRFHNLAKVDVLESNGRPLISIFRGQPLLKPIKIKMMERHPLSSQAFIPLTQTPFVVVVAAPSETVGWPNDLRAFITNGRQGVNYARGVWHHFLLSLDQISDFLVVDRGGKEKNCDEVFFPETEAVTLEF